MVGPRDPRSELEELRRVFREELDDHVSTLEREAPLLAGGAADDDAQRAAVAEIYRAAHSLKGAAHAVEHLDVERLCHALETHLAPTRHARGSVPAARVAALAGLTARALRRWTESPPGVREKILAGARDEIEHASRDAGPATPGPVAMGPQAAPDPGAVPTPPVTERHVTEPRASGSAPTEAPASMVESPPSRRVEPGELRAAFDERAAVPRPDEAPRVHAAPRIEETVRVSVERLGELLSASEDLLALSSGDLDPGGSVAALQEAFLTLRSNLRRARAALREGPMANAPGAGEAAHLIEQSLRIAGDMMGSAVERARRDTGAWRAVASGASGVADRARALRLVPMATLFPALERAAQEAARELGKDLSILFEGGALELDRRVRDGLREPLMHLVRNAVDHGVEARAARRAAGKPEEGTVTIRASIVGRDLRIVVGDDGQGIDLDAVRARAAAHGLDPSVLGRRETFALLFEQGFTTRDAVTSISGRGIGLDVVRKRIASLHGRVDVDSEPGSGTAFTLTLPLDLSVIRGLVVGVRDARFVVLTTAVARLLRVRDEDVVAVEGRLYVREESGLTPLSDLDEVLGLPRRQAILSDGEARPAMVIVAGERRAAFRVDALLDEREIVMRRLGSRVRRAAFVAGAALVGDADVALVLDVADLVHLARPGKSATAAEAAPPRRRVLVVDDSITTRQLMRSILETAGYDVAVASDGQEAWDRLSGGGDAFDLIVSDIEMPRMDGLGLLARVRATPRPTRLPFVLVTALESDIERRRAIELGASAYILKSGFDQENLLDTIEQIL